MDIGLFFLALTHEEKSFLAKLLIREGLLSGKEKRQTVNEWMLDHPDLSIRLRNALQYIRNKNIFIYIDEIDKGTFFKIRNAGLRSWNEFDNIINKERGEC